MFFLLLSLLALGIAALDQFTKYLVVANIPLFGDVPFLPGFIQFTYVQNTGAAFSMMQGMRWVFIAIFAVLTVLIVLEYFKFRMPFSKFDRILIACIYGGGLGNMIDRADCFITCGCILLIIRLAFFNKAFWKDEKKNLEK